MSWVEGGDAQNEDDLAGVVRQFVGGAATAQTLYRAFLVATVYCQAGERPGFGAFGAPPDGLVPVCSSERELVRALGIVPWFAATGADVLSLLPAGYDIILDPGGETPLRLKTAALRPVSVATVDWG